MFRQRLIAVLLAAVALALAGAQSALAVEKPVNTLLPAISGVPKDGGTLKATHGQWSGAGAPTYAYQWQRCEPEQECVNIAIGGTSSEYTAHFVDIGSQLRVVVTASNSAGSGEATSAKTEPVAAVAAKNTALPVISGSPREGQLLTVSNGSWSGTQISKYAYKWERCTPVKHCSQISGATSAEYRVAAADVGETLRAVVTAENLAGSRNATSASTEVVTHGPPVALDLPIISGAPRQGSALHAGTGTWAGLMPIEYEYAWDSCNGEGACTHAAGPTLELGAGDVGNNVRVTVTARNSLGSASTTSTLTSKVLGSPEDSVAAWGEDLRGQLGTLYKAAWEEYPVRAEEETHVKAISTGGSFTLKLHEDGTVTAAGAGYYGSTGYGGRRATWEQGKTHVTTSGLSNVKAISSGAEYSLALLEDGNVMAWGQNGVGTLGNGRGGFEKETGENQLTPKEVRALHGVGVKAIASGGGANFAVLNSGQLMAWGHNRAGQLGIAWPAVCLKVGTCEPEPIRKKPSQEPEDVKNGEHPEYTAHLCLTEVGWEMCSKLPHPVMEVQGETEKPIEHVVQVAAGAEASYALLETGEVLSWGNDNRGQLGQTLEPGSKTTFTHPGRVMINATEQLTHVIAIASGGDHTLALRDDGTVFGWGSDPNFGLGEPAATCGKENKNGGGTWPCDRYATLLPGLEGIHVTAVAAGFASSAVLGEEGKVYTIGQDNYGELGIGPICENEGGEMGYGNTCYVRHWTAVPGLEHVRAISAQLKVMTAIVGNEGNPPSPILNAESGSGSVKLSWNPPAIETPSRVSVRVWQHPGEEPVEAEGEEGEPLEEPAPGEPPVNETLPILRTIEYVEGEKKVVSGGTFVGQSLDTSTGSWSGKAPLSYEFRWLRCKSGKCSPITSWTPGGEAKGEVLPLTEEDAGYQFESQVSARHENEARGVATSAPSEIVKAEGEVRLGASEFVKVEGLDGHLFTQFLGKALEPVQYEFKFQTTGGPKNGKTRTLVAGALP